MVVWDMVCLVCLLGCSLNGGRGDVEIQSMSGQRQGLGGGVFFAIR